MAATAICIEVSASEEVIHCPWCGERDEPEFERRGTTAAMRPRLSASEEEWLAYLKYRDNPERTEVERWHHTRGCGHWFGVARDTLTLEILSVYRLAD
jgi:sarcosine oxidase, subunit delta